jgi:hypothetical protein
MAEKRISELTAKGTTLATTDLIEISESDGLGGYVTKRVTGQNIFDGVSTSNFANANLTFTANRTHNINTYNLTFDNVGAFRVNGKMGINSNPLSYTRLYISAGTGEYAGYFDASDDNAIYAASNSGRAIYAISTGNRGIEAISTNSYGVHAKSANNYALWAQSTSAGTKLSIFSNGQCDFKDYADTLTILKLHDGGKVSMPNLPTSSAGLSAGDLWNDSGTIKIA